MSIPYGSAESGEVSKSARRARFFLVVSLTWMTIVTGPFGCQAHLEQKPAGVDDDTDGDDDATDDDDITDDDDVTDDDDDDTSPDDADGDGYSPADGDCDDSDASVHPGASESCDGIDSDCDGDRAEGCASCLEILEAGASQGDGVYMIDLDDSGAIEIECGMTVDGGGWTLVQRTTDVWADSSALYTDYATFRGSTLGSANGVFRLAGRLWPDLLVEHELLMEFQPRQEDLTPCDSLFYKVSSLSLSVPASGTASASGYSQPVQILADEELSTTDGGPNTSCVNSYDIVPWFIASCGYTNPTFYKPDWWDTDACPRANYVEDSADLHGHTASDVCASDPDELNGYTAGAMMAVWLR